MHKNNFIGLASLALLGTMLCFVAEANAAQDEITRRIKNSKSYSMQEASDTAKAILSCRVSSGTRGYNREHGWETNEQLRVSERGYQDDVLEPKEFLLQKIRTVPKDLTPVEDVIYVWGGRFDGDKHGGSTSTQIWLPFSIEDILETEDVFILKQTRDFEVDSDFSKEVTDEIGYRRPNVLKRKTEKGASDRVFFLNKKEKVATIYNFNIQGSGDFGLRILDNCRW